MISEETLTLYYYEDGLRGSERRAIEQALQADDVLAARYADLCRQLDGWRDLPEAAAPAHMVQRWHDTIERAAQLESQRAGGGARLALHVVFLGRGRDRCARSWHRYRLLVRHAGSCSCRSR